MCFRRRRKLERESWAADFEDDDDFFNNACYSSSSHSPSPQPIYSLRSSPQPPQTNSSCSTTSVANLSTNDENSSEVRNLSVDRYYAEPPPNTDQALRQSQNQQMRSFNIDTRGKIVDCGFRLGRQSRPLTSEWILKIIHD